MRKIILASRSPRRRELLHQIGLEFAVCPSDMEEVVTSRDPAKVVQELAWQKAEAIASRYTDALVIGADTVVAYQGKIMGKPKDEEEAIQMLTELQGNTHSVFTGVTLVMERETVTFAEESKVTLYPMTEEEIRWYVEHEQPMDKAGSYAIQGIFARHIEKIEGDYNNIVGLPVARIYQELKKQGEL